MVICILKVFSTGFICGDFQERLTWESQFSKAGQKKLRRKICPSTFKDLYSFLSVCVTNTCREQTAFFVTLMKHEGLGKIKQSRSNPAAPLGGMLSLGILHRHSQAVPVGPRYAQRRMENGIARALMGEFCSLAHLSHDAPLNRGISFCNQIAKGLLLHAICLSA